MPVYRLLLHLFPASFRAEYEAEMCAVFAARRLQENALLLWISTLLDIATNALAAHFEMLRQDLAWSLRLLRQSAAFTLTAILVTALGIGATSAAFTLLDHVLLRPLPFSHPEQLVMVYQNHLADGYKAIEMSPPNFRDFRAMSNSFSSIGAYSGLSVNLSGQGNPRRLLGAQLMSDVFRTLDVRPAIGRGFTTDDDREGAPNIVLLSDGLAKSLYGDAPAALGRTVRFDDDTYTVVGVMAPGFSFPSRTTQFWTPIHFPPIVYTDRTNMMLGSVARLRPEVSIEQARADLNLVARRLERTYPKDNEGVGATVRGIREALSPQSRMLVIAVFAAAFCLMLIACTNLANLLFARSMQRRRELAVRIAIGAGRERILRQLLTENLVLAIAGGIAGMLLATFATPTLALLVPNGLPIGAEPQLDLRVFAFAAALTISTSLAFGVGPSWRACRNVDMNALRTRSGAAAGSDRLRTSLVLAGIICTVTLLVTAGLLVKALWRVQSVDPGFRAHGVLTLRTTLPAPKYNMEAARTSFYSRVITQARALPGVTSASYISFLPMVFGGGIFPATTPGVAGDKTLSAQVSIRFVTPDFFATLNVPLRRGRDISDRDTRTAPFAVVVSESLARRLWPHQDPIGHQLNVAFFDRTVVGVVGDISVRGLERTSEPQVYLSARQVPNGGLLFFAPKDLVVRASGDPASLAPALERIIHQADPELPVSDVRLLEDIVDQETASRRTQLRVLGAFAAIAFLLAAVGIHGLLSFNVSRRTQEVGVRVALGAMPRDILGMFLRQGLALGAAGVAIALPLAYFAARAMGALLFGVEPGDPSIYAAAALLAIVMTLAGSFRPALRAAGVDPAITIRNE